MTLDHFTKADIIQDTHLDFSHLINIILGYLVLFFWVDFMRLITRTAREEQVTCFNKCLFICRNNRHLFCGSQIKYCISRFEDIMISYTNQRYLFDVEL